MVNKSVELNIVHTYKYKKSSHHSPYDLVNVSPDKVQARQPDITGKTSPPWRYGIIHSKILVADRYRPTAAYKLNSEKNFAWEIL